MCVLWNMRLLLKFTKRITSRKWAEKCNETKENAPCWATLLRVDKPGSTQRIAPTEEIALVETLFRVQIYSLAVHLEPVPGSKATPNTHASLGASRRAICSNVSPRVFLFFSAFLRDILTLVREPVRRKRYLSRGNPSFTVPSLLFIGRMIH